MNEVVISGGKSIQILYLSKSPILQYKNTLLQEIGNTQVKYKYLKIVLKYST